MLTILPGWVITQVGPGLDPQYTRADFGPEAVGSSPTAYKCHDSVFPNDEQGRTLPQQNLFQKKSVLFKENAKTFFGYYM